MLDRIALTILIIGGLNWGSIGLFNFDLVSWIFSGSAHIIARVIFTLVGLCALWCIISLPSNNFTAPTNGRDACFDGDYDRYADGSPPGC